MRRLVRLAARIAYPAQWRARYGEEFDALLDDHQPALGTVFDVIKGGLIVRMREPWGLGKTTFAFGAIGLIAALAIALSLRDQYRSSASLRVTGSPEAVTRIARIAQDALSRDNLKAIADRNLLYPDDRDRISSEALLERMARNIKVDRVIPDGQVRLTFEYGDRAKAQQVMHQLVALLIDENVKKAPPVNAMNGGVIELTKPAPLPESPIFPNRPAIAALGTLGGALIGLAFAAVRRRAAA